MASKKRYLLENLGMIEEVGVKGSMGDIFPRFIGSEVKWGDKGKEGALRY